jgi:predicted CXXCH cytochrome family protein
MIECVSCHDAHREDADPVQRKFLVKGNVRSAVCVTCHQPSGTGWSWGTSPHSTSGKSFTASNTGGSPGLGAHTGFTTVADNGCAGCHRAHTAPQAQRLLKSVNQRDLCYQCHGSTATVAQKNIAGAFAQARSHPLESSTATILHDAAETSTSPTNFSGARRHVVCSDCHNPHGAANGGSPGTGLHAARTNTIGAGSVLVGTPGVEPVAWPAALDRAGAIATMPSPSQTGYAVSASSPREYLICLKCHSSYAFGATPPPSPSGGTQTDASAEFNPNNRSYHPVIGPPRLRVSASNLVSPWNSLTAASRMYCSDCHGNSQATSATVPQGTHGSANAYMLRFGANAAWSTTAPTLAQATGLCFNCHSAATIKSTNSVHGEGNHESAPCQWCHSATPHGSFRPGLIALARDPSPFNFGVAKLQRFRYSTTPNGYQRSSCYSTTSPCHAGHNDATFAPITDPNTFY